jgi:hypothetical protein
VRHVPLAEYGHLNTRICRPVGLAARDRDRVTVFMRASVGKTYDLKNVIDLARYLVSLPVPHRLGGGFWPSARAIRRGPSARP